MRKVETIIATGSFINSGLNTNGNMIAIEENIRGSSIAKFLGNIVANVCFPDGTSRYLYLYNY